MRSYAESSQYGAAKSCLGGSLPPLSVLRINRPQPAQKPPCAMTISLLLLALPQSGTAAEARRRKSYGPGPWLVSRGTELHLFGTSNGSSIHPFQRISIARFSSFLFSSFCSMWGLSTQGELEHNGMISPHHTTYKVNQEGSASFRSFWDRRQSPQMDMSFP